jgi:hypothetical protein
MNMTGYVKDSYVELTDDAKCTIKQTTLYHTPGMNVVGYINDSYVELTDDAKPTIRQTTMLRDYTGQLNADSSNLGYVKDMNDVAKTTVRQTTMLRDYTGHANADSSNLGYVKDMDDIAKPTIRQTTLLMDHTGVLTGIVGENISHQAAENMTIDERRQISTYNRSANGKRDLYGPYINRETVKLNEPLLVSYVPGPRASFDYGATPINPYYEDLKPEIDFSQYYINRNFINTLATNPLVNNIQFQKNI